MPHLNPIPSILILSLYFGRFVVWKQNEQHVNKPKEINSEAAAQCCQE